VIDGESRTLATLYLSQFNEELMKLSEADAHFFHNYVAKLLFYVRGLDLTYKQPKSQKLMITKS